MPKTSRKKATVLKTQEAIIQHIDTNYRFGKDESRQLFICDITKGTYVSNAEDRIREIVTELLPLKKFSRRLLEEIVMYFTVTAETMWERPRMDKLNLKNGIFNLDTGQLEPHTPEHLSAVQLPIIYDPNATCPHWDEFIKQTFPDDAVELPYELAAWLMLPNMYVQKSVVLKGEGANGKSIFLHGLMSFIGSENATKHSLHTIEYDKFTPATLKGKLANICGDIPNNKLVNTSSFKQITGGDEIMAQHKFGRPFSFKPFCRLVFSANKMPDTPDHSEGFFRRFLVVPFDNKFEESAAMDRKLRAGLTTQRELSGLLNRALDALPRVLEHGLSEPESCKNQARIYRADSDPLPKFLFAYFRETECNDDFVINEDLTNRYNELNEGQEKTPEQVGRAVSMYFPNVKRLTTRMPDGSFPKAYKGVKILSFEDVSKGL